MKRFLAFLIFLLGVMYTAVSQQPLPDVQNDFDLPDTSQWGESLVYDSECQEWIEITPNDPIFWELLDEGRVVGMHNIVIEDKFKPAVRAVSPGDIFNDVYAVDMPEGPMSYHWDHIDTPEAESIADHHTFEFIQVGSLAAAERAISEMLRKGYCFYPEATFEFSNLIILTFSIER